MSEDANPGEVFPIDDGGINNDHIIDLCDFIINSLHEKYIGTKQKTPPSVSELKDMAQTLHGVWTLVQDIMELDNRLRMFIETQSQGETEEPEEPENLEDDDNDEQ